MAGYSKPESYTRRNGETLMMASHTETIYAKALDRNEMNWDYEPCSVLIEYLDGIGVEQYSVDISVIYDNCCTWLEVKGELSGRDEKIALTLTPENREKTLGLDEVICPFGRCSECKRACRRQKELNVQEYVYGFPMNDKNHSPLMIPHDYDGELVFREAEMRTCPDCGTKYFVEKDREGHCPNCECVSDATCDAAREVIESQVVKY